MIIIKVGTEEGGGGTDVEQGGRPQTYVSSSLIPTDMQFAECARKEHCFLQV